MKKNLLLVLIGLLIPLCGWADKQGYAVFDSETGTLTFKYGEKPEGENVFDTDETGFSAPWDCSQIKKVVFDSSFADARPKSTARWFYEAESLTEIVDMKYLNTSNVTYMSNMFFGCSGLTSLDVSNFDTSNVTGMSFLFSYCSGLTTIYVGDKWNIANVTDGESVFSGCTSLVGGKGTAYDTSHIDYTYARIDGGADAPGYFTVKSGVAETCDITIGKNGKTTFCGSKGLDFSFSNEVKAFTATGYDASTKTIWLTRVRKVQKGEGLLLKGTGGETYTIPSSGVQAAYENMIVGNIGDEITINGTSEDGTLTNYYLKGGTYMSVSGNANIGTNKSYLQLPTSMLAGATGARSEDTSYSSDVLGTQENLGYLGNLGMPSTCHLAELETESMPVVFQNTTGIKDNNRETITNNRDDQWFTLSGQRIDKPTKKGLYIHDGRKVVVK